MPEVYEPYTGEIGPDFEFRYALKFSRWEVFMARCDDQPELVRYLGGTYDFDVKYKRFDNVSHDLILDVQHDSNPKTTTFRIYLRKNYSGPVMNLGFLLFPRENATGNQFLTNVTTHGWLVLNGPNERLTIRQKRFVMSESLMDDSLANLNGAIFGYRYEGKTFGEVYVLKYSPLGWESTTFFVSAYRNHVFIDPRVRQSKTVRKGDKEAIRDSREYPDRARLSRADRLVFEKMIFEYENKLQYCMNEESDDESSNLTERERERLRVAEAQARRDLFARQRAEWSDARRKARQMAGASDETKMVRLFPITVEDIEENSVVIKCEWSVLAMDGYLERYAHLIAAMPTGIPFSFASYNVKPIMPESAFINEKNPHSNVPVTDITPVLPSALPEPSRPQAVCSNVASGAISKRSHAVGCDPSDMPRLKKLIHTRRTEADPFCHIFYEMADWSDSGKEIVYEWPTGFDHTLSNKEIRETIRKGMVPYRKYLSTRQGVNDTSAKIEFLGIAIFPRHMVNTA